MPGQPSSDLPPWVWKARWWLVFASFLVIPTNVIAGIQMHNPVMWASPVLMTVYFLATLRRSFFQIATEIYLYTDMLRVLTFFFVGTMSPLFLYLSIFGTGITYLVTNLIFVRKLRTAVILAIYLLIPVVLVFIRPLPAMMSMLVVANGIFLAFVVVLIQVSRSREDRESMRRLERYQAESKRLQEEQELHKVSEALLVHDARNLLQRLTLIELEHLKGRASEEAVSVAKDVRNGLAPTLDLLSNLSQNRIHLRDFLKEICLEEPEVRFSMSVSDDTEILFNPRLLRSVVGNLIRNAKQAIPGRTLSVHLEHQNGRLLVEDNAGGFDPGTLVEGVSSKPGSQGRFLTTLLRYQRAMGLAVTIERLSHGTRFSLEFLNPGSGAN